MRKIFRNLLLGMCLLLALPLTASAALNITAATFPVWLLMRQIVQDVPDVELELMIPATAGCPHDYVLTPQDIMRLSGTDILVINGQGLDDFVASNAEALADDNGRELKIIDCCRNLGMVMLQYTPEEDEYVDGYDDEDMAVNAHGFASPFIYKRMLDSAAAELAALDPANAAQYLANAGQYGQRLDQLGDLYFEFSETVRPGLQVLTQHSVLDYIARDTGLQVAGHIQEHEGQEPSAAALLELNALIPNKQVLAIFTEPQYPDKTGRTLAEENGVPVLELDPLASGPANADQDYYITVMTENLRKLERLFGQ